MLNKVYAFIRQQQMVTEGDHIICALSGGADSVALLFSLYLLREKLQIKLSAAHFNHGLRGEESQRDQQFAEDLCQRYDIPIFVGNGKIVPGKKGLEAAAREGRYRFFDTLEGKIATAHTADDNAETVLMHLVRGSGLKGLGGIAPVRGKILRPMLTVTRQEVLEFIEEYHLSFVEDSSNCTDQFLRNRIRHKVMPLLKAENPRLCEGVTQMALGLRQDNVFLESMTQGPIPPVSQLRQMPQPLRRRYLHRFMEENRILDVQASYIIQLEELVMSKRPSAYACFPPNVTVSRIYDTLQAVSPALPLQTIPLQIGQTVELPAVSLRISCEETDEECFFRDRFTVYPQGQMVIRSRMAGDWMKLLGGAKTLKELFIDKKIAAGERCTIPVIADDKGILGVWCIGANCDRTEGQGKPVLIRFEPM